MKPKIYLFTGFDIMHQLTGYALAEDGSLLASAQFPDIPTAQARMGLLGRRPKVYGRHYPEGFELVWVDDYETHPGCLEARRLNAALWEAGRPERDAEHARQMAGKAAKYQLGLEVVMDGGDDLAINQPDCWED